MVLLHSGQLTFMAFEFHALVVEDDHDIAQLVALQMNAIRGSSHHVDHLYQATTYLQNEHVDIVILDLSLPDGDGLDFCRQFRLTNPTTPILMLTARCDEIDRVLGLELGADDYLSKPFGLAELKARIKALLRRSNAQNNIVQTPVLIELKGLTIDIPKHQVILRNEELSLTSTEFDLLKLFALHPNRVFSRLELLEKIWGTSHDGYEHTVNSHLNRLRKKIEVSPHDPQILETIWGVGYKLNPDKITLTTHDK